MSSYRALVNACRTLESCCKSLDTEAEFAGPNVALELRRIHREILPHYRRIRDELASMHAEQAISREPDVEASTDHGRMEDRERAYEQDCRLSRKDVA